MRKTFVLLALVLLASAATAQSTVHGKISDTLEKKSLANAVVTLLYKSDSTLFKFARSNNKGEFSIPNVGAGKYVMLVSFPKFADYVDEVDVKEGTPVDLGTIALTQKAQLLKEVVVRGNAAIRIKGDTTEFTADSFAVREGATVEDLLKRLPGFQVNSKGEITAQGKRVEKVLVDGEEFFGDDPTMATQNITSKAVDKVQLYDTKTEQQNLTGISTGTEGKTLNIKLKEDKKKGAFGKINAGSDFRDYVDAKALYNRFVGKKKVSVYGTKSNVNTGSLSWDDRQKMGIEDDYEYDEISGFYYSFGESDDFSNWSLRGLPNSYSAGGLFINKWNEDRQSFNSSYRYNRLATENENSTFTQNILPTSINYRNKFSNSTGLNQQHAVNGKYEWKLDSLTSFKFTTAGSYKETEVFANVRSEFLNGAKERINTSEQERNNHTEKSKWDNQLVYKQLFKKKNRQLLTTLRFGLTDDVQNGFNNTKIDFYKNGQIDSTAPPIDQLRLFDGSSKSIGVKFTYNEPLSAKWNLVLDYAHNRNNATSYRNTFNKSSNGKYEDLDPVFSNNFDLKAFSHSSMAVLRFVDKKLKMAAGSGLSAIQLRLLNVDNKTRNTYNFLNITPQAQVGYAFKPQTNLSFNYRGTTRQPSIDQLQPIRNNEDPLYEFTGNPDLKVGFTHQLSVFYNQYKVLSGRGIWVNVSYNLVENDITNLTTIDAERGKQVYMPVNVNGNRNWNFWANWNRWRGQKKLHYGVQLNGNGGNRNNFIQQNNLIVQNQTTYSSLNFRLTLGFQEEEKKSFDFHPKLGYNRSNSSIQTSINNNYFTYGGEFHGFVMLPGKLELSTNLNVDLRQRLPEFPDNINLTIWNASLARKIFKKKTGKIIFEANDILDQNKGINRIINSNFIQEDRFQRISRYFLLRFEWTFNKMAGQSK
jgi:hypothetical protein